MAGSQCCTKITNKKVNKHSEHALCMKNKTAQMHIKECWLQLWLYTWQCYFSFSSIATHAMTRAMKMDLYSFPVGKLPFVSMYRSKLTMRADYFVWNTRYAIGMEDH